VIPNHVSFGKAFAVGSGGKVQDFTGVTCTRTPIPDVESNTALIIDRAGVQDDVVTKVKDFFRDEQSEWMFVLPPSLIDVSWELPKRVVVARWVRLPEMVLPRESASLSDPPPTGLLEFTRLPQFPSSGEEDLVRPLPRSRSGKDSQRVVTLRLCNPVQ